MSEEEQHEGEAGVSKVIKLHGVNVLKKLEGNNNPGQKSSGKNIEIIEVSRLVSYSKHYICQNRI